MTACFALLDRYEFPVVFSGNLRGCSSRIEFSKTIGLEIQTVA